LLKHQPIIKLNKNGVGQLQLKFHLQLNLILKMEDLIGDIVHKMKHLKKSHIDYMLKHQIFKVQVLQVFFI